MSFYLNENKKLRSHIFVGARLVMQDRIRLSMFDYLASRVHGLSDDRVEEIWGYHNAYTTLIVMMLKLFTGERDVIDPFHDLSVFDLENGYVLIADKAVTEKHTSRLVSLPPFLVEYVKDYINYLRNLSCRLHRFNQSLSKRIWAVTDIHQPHPDPFFFYFEASNFKVISITPSRLASMMASRTALPMNLNRAELATQLMERDCLPELVNMQLGHIEPGSEPYGPFSVWSPQQVSEVMQPLMEDIFNENYFYLEQKVVAGKGYRLPNMKNFNREVNVTVKHGAEQRAEKRQAKWREENAFVKMFVSTFFNEHIPDMIPDEQLNTLIMAMHDEVDNNKKYRHDTCYNLLRRHLLYLRRKEKITVSIPGQLSRPRFSRPAFDDKSMARFRAGEVYRQRFIDYLSTSCDMNVTYERRVAEILIAMVVFGAQTYRKVLANAVKGLTNFSFVVNDIAFVDIPLSDAAQYNIRRFYFDPVTQALFTGLKKVFTAKKDNIDNDLILEHIVHLLGVLGITLTKRQRRQSDIVKLLKPLTNVMKVWWRRILPGLVAAYCEGEHRAVSIPLPNLVRWLTDQRVVIPINTTDNVKKDDETQPRIIRFNADKANWRRGLEGWDEINKILKTTALKNTKTKDNYIKGFNRLSETFGNTMPPVVQLLLHWGQHLCLQGAWEKKLKSSSIRNYLVTIGSGLVEQGADLDMLLLNEEGYEELYRRVVASSKNEKPSYVRDRLKAFHHFLVKYYAMPGELDWDEVFLSDDEDPAYVDAMLITQAEYDRAFALLRDDPDCDERQRLTHMMILFFCFHFGLRRGEVYRLTVSDVICYGKMIIVYVRSSPYGETKTHNGVRQIPLFDTLHDEERQFLKQWLAHIETYAEQDPLSVLFARKGEHRSIVEISTSTQRVVDALRSATGDPTLRLRHLRHGYASRLMMAMLMPEQASQKIHDVYTSLWCTVSPSEIRKTMLGLEALSSRSIFETAMFMGHGHPSTTLNHYTHTLDLIVKTYTDRQSFAYNDKALAYAYQIRHDNIRQIKKRQRDKGIDDPYLLQYYKKHLRGCQAPIKLAMEGKYTLPPLTNTAQSTTMSYTDIDRILVLIGARKQVHGIAERFFMSEASLMKLVCVAKQIQDETGYLDFGLPVTDESGCWIQPRDIEQHDSITRDARGPRTFLEQLADMEIDSEQVKLACKIWQSGFIVNDRRLLITNRHDLTQFCHVMETLGIPITDFEAYIPTSENVHQWAHIKQELKEQGFIVKVDKKLPLHPQSQDKHNRIGIILRAGQSHTLEYQKALNRVLFVMWCTLMMSADDRDEKVK